MKTIAKKVHVVAGLQLDGVHGEAVLGVEVSVDALTVSADEVRGVASADVNHLIGTGKLDLRTVLFKAAEPNVHTIRRTVSNEFVNTMTQSATVQQLLPIEAEESSEMSHHWDYIYEPDAEELLEALMTRYVESQVYQAVVENAACEQAARMLAMKNASDNAGELIDELQLVYNKARQAAITQELSEIVGGAAAVS